MTLTNELRNKLISAGFMEVSSKYVSIKGNLILNKFEDTNCVFYAVIKDEKLEAPIELYCCKSDGVNDSDCIELGVNYQDMGCDNQVALSRTFNPDGEHPNSDLIRFSETVLNSKSLNELIQIFEQCEVHCECQFGGDRIKTKSQPTHYYEYD